MKNSITENEIEEIAIQYLVGLGYEYISGIDISPDGDIPERQYNDVVLQNRLRIAIDRLNPTLNYEAKDAAFRKLLRFESTDALISNETVHK